MNERETNLLRAARAMHAAILAQGFMAVEDILDDLEVPAEDIDAALAAYPAGQARATRRRL